MWKTYIGIYNRNLSENPQVEAIEIVCHADWIDYLKEMIENYDLSKVKWITHGGETFQKSVINGMEYLKDKLDVDDIVMIHYGAAPFSSQQIVTDGIKSVRNMECQFHVHPVFN